MTDRLRRSLLLISLIAIAGTGDSHAQFPVDNLWARIRGAKYSSPITVSHDSTAIIVNGDRYEIDVDERTPHERILNGDYGEYEVFQHAAEKIASARGASGSVPAETLEAIVTEANDLLAEKGLPEIGIALNADTTDATILHNGKDTGARVEIGVHRPISRAEMVRRVYDAITGSLSSGRCVAWGDSYLASYSAARGVAVDSAIALWHVDKTVLVEPLANDDEPIEIFGESVPRGMLYDIDSLPHQRQ